MGCPLNQLRKKDVPWIWEGQEEEALQTLRAALLCAPILRRPDWDRPFILATDYSQVAIGAILSQTDEEGREYVIAYASRKLTPAECNYSASEGECLAVVHAATVVFRPYLLGRRFTIITDHQALTWLISTHGLTGRLARWALRLQELI